MTDSNLLKGAIRSKGLTQKEIAKAINISTASFNYKINNKRQFTAKEISRLATLLGIKEKDSYFFAFDVAKKETK